MSEVVQDKQAIEFSVITKIPRDMTEHEYFEMLSRVAQVKILKNEPTQYTNIFKVRIEDCDGNPEKFRNYINSSTIKVGNFIIRPIIKDNGKQVIHHEISL